jgi:hypothetical protein
MGQQSVTGWWYYFAAAFLIKTPIPTILLAAGAGIFGRKYLRNNTILLLCALPVCLFLLLTAIQDVNIGLRYILPVYPFIFLLVSGLFTIKHNVMKYAIAVICAWYAIISFRIHPDYLAYFNELAGGPGNGHKCLVDSNLDWGQDLPALRAYMEENRIDKVNLSYFGCTNPKYYGINYNYLPGYIVLPADYEYPQTDIQNCRYFAISATMLQGLYLPDKDLYRYFRSIEPCGRAGYSILIYKLNKEEIEEAFQSNRSVRSN